MNNRKTVLVTGGSRGIGRAICLEFAKSGYFVAINYNNSKTDAENLKEEIIKMGVKAEIYKADVSSALEVTSMKEKVYKDFGFIDVLVNNAGVALYKLFDEVSDDEWRRVFDINVKGVFNCCKIFGKEMIYKKCGSIINISSMWGEVGASMESVYSASKSAVIGFTKALAKELAPSKITVNAIAPGAIETDMMKSFSSEEIESLKNEIPLNRLGRAEEVATLAYFLSNASYITGQVIGINGGFVI